MEDKVSVAPLLNHLWCSPITNVKDGELIDDKLVMFFQLDP